MATLLLPHIGFPWKVFIVQSSETSSKDKVTIGWTVKYSIHIKYIFQCAFSMWDVIETFF